MPNTYSQTMSATGQPSTGGSAFKFDNFQTQTHTDGGAAGSGHSKSKRNRNRNRRWRNKRRSASDASSGGDHTSATTGGGGGGGDHHTTSQRHHQHRGQSKPSWYTSMDSTQDVGYHQQRRESATGYQSNRFRDRAMSNASIGGQSVASDYSSSNRQQLQYNRPTGGHQSYYRQQRNDDRDGRDGPNDRYNKDRLSREIWNFYLDNSQTLDLMTRKNRLRDALHKILTQHFPEFEAQLFIVGSSANGLANNKSDVDICLVMNKIGEKLATTSDDAMALLAEKSKEMFSNVTPTRYDLLDTDVTAAALDAEKMAEEMAKEMAKVVVTDETSGEIIVASVYESDNEKPSDETLVDSPRSTGSAAVNDPSVPMLKKVEEVLKAYNFVQNMQIIMAKVPILKFVDRLSGIEVTLNVNKMVSIQNTQLILDYTKIDWRVQPLVMVIKAWAKDNGINDAYNKSLSSYSLVLMVIHYLQYACSPPVLPCLQQLDPSRYTVSESMHALRTNRRPKRWRSANDGSLRDLLLGFLDYYSYSFCFAKDAISVRSAHVLPKHVCQRYKSGDNNYSHWKFICIEEPFTRTNTARSVYDVVTFERILSVHRVSHYTLRRYPKLDSIMTGREYSNDYSQSIQQYVSATTTGGGGGAPMVSSTASDGHKSDDSAGIKTPKKGKSKCGDPDPSGGVNTPAQNRSTPVPNAPIKTPVIEN